MPGFLRLSKTLQKPFNIKHPRTIGQAAALATRLEEMLCWLQSGDADKWCRAPKAEKVDIHIHTYIHTHTHTYIYVYVYAYGYEYMCTYVCMYVCMYVCIYVCMYECMYVCIYVCMYVNMYLRMYVYLFVCTNTHKHARTLSLLLIILIELAGLLPD